MALYEILANRGCIWVLKLLYDREITQKKAFTVPLSEIKRILGLKANSEYIVSVLAKDGLLHLDKVGNDSIISLTQKGKEFFKQFDKLKTTIEAPKQVERKFAKIEYNLTDPEKKALILAYRIGKETGKDIPLKSLAQEMHPYDANKNSVVYKHIGKLEKLNLMSKIKKGKVSYVSLTDSGKRTIKEQLIESLTKELE